MTTTVKAHTSGPIVLDATMKAEYEAFWNTAEVGKGWLDAIDRVILRIALNRQTYEKVSAEVSAGAGSSTPIPWYFIAAVHMRERDLSFKHHLHNGDPLNARTKLHPAGRPVSGSPPFTWQESAVDALRYQGLDKWKDWSLAGLLFQLEAYNGFGYRKRGLASPYLWSGTNHYTSGKYVELKDPATGKWKSAYKAELVDKQIGVAALIRRMQTTGLVSV